MRKINVLGINLRDYSVRESLRRINLYLNNNQCNTIDFVTHNVLLLAAGSEELTGNIEKMDMTVLATPDILQAAGVSSHSREKEIENNLLLKGIFRKLAKEKRKIYLLSENQDSLSELALGMGQFSNELYVVGNSVPGDSEENDDTIVNDINSVLPDVILTNLPSPNAEKFISDNRKRMNVKLAVIIRDVSLKTTEDGKVKKGGLRGFLMRKFFHSAAANYVKDSERKNIN